MAEETIRCEDMDDMKMHAKLGEKSSKFDVVIDVGIGACMKTK